VKQLGYTKITTHTFESIELIHAVTVMYEDSVTRKKLRLEFLRTFSP